MRDDQFERLLREVGRDYHRPPAPPRLEMWRRIEAARAGQSDRRVRPAARARRHPWRWAAGIAATVALGVGVGRLTLHEMTGPRGTGPEAGSASKRNTGPAVAYRITAIHHLGQAEVFLTEFRMSVQRGEASDPLAVTTARRLLATNRLLIDSPAATADRRLRVLLEDLELVLARIAVSSPRPVRGDLKLIAQGMDQMSVMARLRTEVPAGTGIVPRQGAL